MSLVLIVRCDGCPAKIEQKTGQIGSRSRMPPGWTTTRGVGDAGTRPRLDWCPACTLVRRMARKTLRYRRHRP